MHRFLREDRITLERGQIVRILNARPAGKEKHEAVDVYKETETGREYVRNLYFCQLGGYMVEFPDEKSSGKRRNTDGWCEPNINIGKTAFDTSFHLTDSERDLILSKYPDFKWVLAKWDGNKAQVMKVLQIWRKHKEIEFPLSLGYYNIAVNKNFYKAGNKDVIRYLVKNKPNQYTSLGDIQMILRRGIDEKELENYKSFCRRAMRKFAYDEYKYLEKIGMADFRGSGIYHDYKEMAANAGHNLKDPYWHFPKDLCAAHGKVLEELNRKRELERLARIERERNAAAEKARTEIEKYARYKEIAGKFAHLNSVVDGFAVFVPETADDWEIQANELHQCIVAADYMGKVVAGKCLLVFVRKEGKPVATAEVLENGAVGQFYADELDRNDCLPSDEVRRAFGKWLEKFKGELLLAAA